MQALNAIFHPRSLAIVGASDDPALIGGRPLDHIQRLGFEGRLLAVNPKHRTVQGQSAFASVLDVPGDIDCALLLCRVGYCRRRCTNAASWVGAAPLCLVAALQKWTPKVRPRVLVQMGDVNGLESSN